MPQAGKLLMLVGGLLFGAGLFLTLADRLPPGSGRLPGDIVWRGKNTTIYFPLGVCLLLSIVLSLISMLFRRR